MAIEPRELEQVERPDAGRRSGLREGPRGRRAATAPAETKVEAPDRRRWVQRHGATVFIAFVFVFLALLVVVKRLAM